MDVTPDCYEAVPANMETYNNPTRTFTPCIFIISDLNRLDYSRVVVEQLGL